VGNARTALFNWLFARQNDGSFILRVEDTDVERSTAEYDRKLMADLRWLGLDWDEGPDIGGGHGPYRQSQRIETYESLTQKLLSEAKAYHCFCPPEELEEERQRALAAGKMPVYSGKCRAIPFEEARRRMSEGEPAAVRLLTPEKGTIGFRDLVRGPLQFDLSLIGDPILVRSNGIPAYNYAVVVDDALMAISHVIRGEDHIQNTPRQLLICQALDVAPPQFAHLSMVMGRDGARLSKRHGATSVDQFESEGILPEALFNYLALLGWAPPEGRESLNRDELVDLFRLEKVSRSAAIFDYDKLHWINRQHIKALPTREKSRLAHRHLHKAGLLPDALSDEQWQWLDRAVEAVIEKIDRFADLRRHFRPIFEFAPERMDSETKTFLTSECCRKVITRFAGKLSRVERFDYDTFAALAKEIKDETGCKGKDLYHPLRVALTAQESGLELDKLIPLIEAGSNLGLPKPVKNCAERVKEMRSILTDQ
jgi:glutamyl-tRNA synthetase